MTSVAVLLGLYGSSGAWDHGWIGGGESGGSTIPAWVPANAKIHIDLVGNRAWTEAGGEVAIDTLLGSDT